MTAVGSCQFPSAERASFSSEEGPSCTSLFSLRLWRRRLHTARKGIRNLCLSSRGARQSGHLRRLQGLLLQQDDAMNRILWPAPSYAKFCTSAPPVQDVENCEPIRESLDGGSSNWKTQPQREALKLAVDIDTFHMPGHSGFLQFVTTETRFGGAVRSQRRRLAAT